jgi:hypothetical protein
MDSTLNGRSPPYIGGDLTDRYSKGCRDVDVCGLTPGADGTLTASFWFWRWDAAPTALDVDVIADELNGVRAAMLDGPQGLATHGKALRDCERRSAAVGKTPDARPALSRPFAGFICSSLDLFAALKRIGANISPPGLIGGVSEVYPGHIWTILAGRHFLPRKSTKGGRLARKHILETLGILGLPELPSHDQNDACIAAVLAAAADDAISGLTPIRIGSPLLADPDDTLREGPMVIPEVTTKTRELISEVLDKTPLSNETSDAGSLSSFDAITADCAKALLDCLIAAALQGNPLTCTYSWAYRHLFNASYKSWSQGYGNQVIKLAQQTHLRVLPGLGPIRLDAFIVDGKSRRPNDGHWDSANYDHEDWERVLGAAVVLR